MWAALGQVLPIAVAAAMSSVPILIALSILLSPHKRQSGPAFLFGWIVGIAVALVAFTALAHVIPSVPPRKSQVAIGVSLIVIGLALLILAIVVWRRASQPEAAVNPDGLPRPRRSPHCRHSDSRWRSIFGRKACSSAQQPDSPFVGRTSLSANSPW